MIRELAGSGSPIKRKPDPYAPQHVNDTMTQLRAEFRHGLLKVSFTSRSKSEDRARRSPTPEVARESPEEKEQEPPPKRPLMPAIIPEVEDFQLPADPPVQEIHARPPGFHQPPEAEPMVDDPMPQLEPGSAAMEVEQRPPTANYGPVLAVGAFFFLLAYLTD